MSLLRVFVAAILLVLVAGRPAAVFADSFYLPGPRIEVTSMSAQAFAAIKTRRSATHFVRLDDESRYVIYGAHAHSPSFPSDLTPARGRAYLDGFAAAAPSMGCRTDDVADAYEFLLQAALLGYNGTHFTVFEPGPVIRCGIGSFGAVRLDSVVHIYLGGSPAFGRLSDRQKQRLYETLIVAGAYLLDSIATAKPSSAALQNARADAGEAVRKLTGFRASRVHLTDAGVSIDDQAR